MYPRKETTTSFSTDTKSIDKADKFDISANLKMDFMSICSLKDLFWKTLFRWASCRGGGNELFDR